ncbi:MAG: mannonate dehydratase [Ectothiorhodospiraceae bacterium]|nr:mannonate dehydratase [Ectothiorhodospiraceae bacterium]
MPGRIRIAAGSIREADDETLTFAAQLGVSGVILNTPPLTGEAPYGSMQSLGTAYWRRPGPASPPVKWDFLELLHLRKRIESHGLRLEAIENVPIHFYEDCLTGGPRRDEQLRNYCDTIRALGAAGIPVLGYHWMANRVWRTSKDERTRGGAGVSSFDLDLAARAPLTFGREIDEVEVWSHYTRFIETVLPVAEAEGVTLALHPDDPPVPSLGGVARVFRDLAGFRRALEIIAPSPRHKLDFCMGTWAEMGVETMMAGLRHFVAAGKVAYIHFRNVQGCVPRFREAFLDEGDVDVVAVIRLLVENDFDGVLIDDHVPHMVNDTVWMHRGRAYATGYMKGLVHAVEALRTSGTPGA